MEDREKHVQDRIREVAHRIWREEGCPQGRADAHWQMARDLVAVEEGYEHGMLKPNPTAEPSDIGPAGEPVEEAKLQENLGEFPTLTDQGEQQSPEPIPQPKPAASAPKRAADGAAAAPKRRTRTKKGT